MPKGNGEARTFAPKSLHATLAVLMMIFALVLAACGGGATTTESSESTAAPSESAAASASPAASPAASSPAAGAVPKIEGEVTVFTAASLTDAFTEMGKTLEAGNPGATVKFNFAGSQTLQTQLAQGARADVFASANVKQMDAAQTAGTIASEPEIFVHNTLVVIVPAANPAGINDLQALANPGVKLVLAAPEVPVGKYARETIEKLSQDPAYGSDYATKVMANVVSNEPDVKSVVSKVQLGEADAGIVYSSDVTPDVRPDVKVIDIPEQFNVKADYPIATVKDAENPTGGQAFIDYVLSPAGQETLKKWGFIPAKPAS